MSYDLYFLQPAAAPVDAATLRDWFSSRSGYQVGDGGAVYTDPSLGFRFEFGFRKAEGEEAPLELIINGPRPHLFGEVMEPEVRAVVERFGLRVDDPQQDGMGRGDYDGGKFVAGWSFFNRFLHQVLFGRIGNQPSPSLPAARWEAMRRWNRDKEQLAEGDRVFLPHIELGVIGDRAVTWVALAGPIATRLPEVDYLLTPSAKGLRLVLFSSLPLASFARGVEPAPHYIIDDAEPLAESLSGGEPWNVERVGGNSLLTEELVRAGVEGRQERSELEQIQGAVTAFNESRYAVAVWLCEAISGEYHGLAEELRTQCLGELARYDEAEALYEKVLARKPDEPMFWNSRAYFLVGAGRDEEARQCYARALELLEPLLAGEPQKPQDLWSRKAYALLGLGRPKEAQPAAEKALSLDGEHFFATQNLGRSAIALGDLTAADQAIARAQELRPASPYPRFYRARILAAKGKQAAAKKALREAVEVSPHLGNLARRDPILASLL